MFDLLDWRILHNMIYYLGFVVGFCSILFVYKYFDMYLNS